MAPIDETRRNRLIALSLVVATVAIYARVLGAGFILYDDPAIVSANPIVQRGLTLEGLRWAFTTSHTGYPYPLSWLSHMLDVQLFGMRPGLHHLTSVLIHAANTVLLFVLLQRATGATRRCVGVAALFALHPMHVESVAWIAERKDVLSTFFWLLAALAWVGYSKKPAVARYASALGLFALALLAKPMVLTFPAVILLLDFWPLRRILPSWRASEEIAETAPVFPRVLLGRAALEKAPFLALALVSAAITFHAQKAQGVMAPVERLTLAARLTNVAVAYATYVGKTAWPVNLAVVYPYAATYPAWEVALSAAVLAAGTVIALVSLRRRPWIFVGWFWFLGMLVPVIGFVQVGSQSMADRYTYLPLVGLFLIAAWALEESLRAVIPGAPSRYTSVGRVFAGFVLAGFSAVTVVQTGYWATSLDLFGHAVAVTGPNFVAELNLGAANQLAGNLDEAEKHLRRALEITPGSSNVEYNLGQVAAARTRNEEAETWFRAAAEHAPRNAKARENLGSILIREGRPEEAIASFRDAIRVDPRAPQPHQKLAQALQTLGRADEAGNERAEFERLQAEPIRDVPED